MNCFKFAAWAAFWAGAGMTASAAISLSDINFVDSNAGPVSITAEVAGTGYGGGVVYWAATLDSGLLKLYHAPDMLEPGTNFWTSSWNPYFRGRYDFDITAVDLPPTAPPTEYQSSHTVGVARAISGALIALQYSNSFSGGAWANLDVSKVKLHCIGYNTDETEVASIGCNLLNANFEPNSGMSPEVTDIGFTDISSNYPVGTVFRFDVDLHARPTSIMGFGGLSRFVWTPQDPGNPAGAGNLSVDVASCSPWRSSYTYPLGAHAGFAPLFFGDPEDAEEFEGALMCTTAHYLDVAPSMPEDEADRIGLVVDGHAGTTNYLQIFLPDRILEAWGITNLANAAAVKAQLGYFVDGLELDEEDAAPVVMRLEDAGGMFEFEWDGDGVADAGCLVRFTFVFPEEPVSAARANQRGLAVEVGPHDTTPPEPKLGPSIQVNGQTGEVVLAVGELMDITVSMNAGQYSGVAVDWWFVVCTLSAQPVWYCMNAAGQLEVFDGNNLATCRPALQGPLFDLTPYSVVSMPMPPGNYQIWFAVDYPMDGFLDVQGQLMMDTVIIYGAQ